MADRGAVKGALPQHHLETVVFGRVVGAGDHDPAIEAESTNGEIEHRRRAAPDPQHIEAAVAQPLDNRRLEFRRAQPPVIADGGPAATGLLHHGPEATPYGIGIPRGKGAPDDAADVVFADRGGVEAMRILCHSAPIPDLPSQGRPMLL